MNCIWNWHGKTIISIGEYRHGSVHDLFTEAGIGLGQLEFDVMRKLMTFQGYKRGQAYSVFTLGNSYWVTNNNELGEDKWTSTT